MSVRVRVTVRVRVRVRVRVTVRVRVRVRDRARGAGDLRGGLLAPDLRVGVGLGEVPLDLPPRARAHGAPVQRSRAHAGAVQRTGTPRAACMHAHMHKHRQVRMHRHERMRMARALLDLPVVQGFAARGAVAGGEDEVAVVEDHRAVDHLAPLAEEGGERLALARALGHAPHLARVTARHGHAGPQAAGCMGLQAGCMGLQGRRPGVR